MPPYARVRAHHQRTEWAARPQTRWRRTNEPLPTRSLPCRPCDSARHRGQLRRRCRAHRPAPCGARRRHGAFGLEGAARRTLVAGREPERRDLDVAYRPRPPSSNEPCSRARTSSSTSSIEFHGRASDGTVAARGRVAPVGGRARRPDSTEPSVSWNVPNEAASRSMKRNQKIT